MNDRRAWLQANKEEPNFDVPPGTLPSIASDGCILGAVASMALAQTLVGAARRNHRRRRDASSTCRMSPRTSRRSRQDIEEAFQDTMDVIAACPVSS
jgi:hypothetical protein